MNLLEIAPQKADRYVVRITSPCESADDNFHAVLRGYPIVGSILLTLPEFCGTTPVDCEFTLPTIGTFRIPGLNNPSFRIESIPTCNRFGQPDGTKIIRLPEIYVHLNQALKVLTLQRTSRELDSYDVQYDWTRLAKTLEMAACSMAAHTLERQGLRTREGLGFMALTQANPNLRHDEIGIGIELANKLLLNVQQYEAETLGEPTGRFRTISDLAGLKLGVVVKFPVTTSKSVRIDMRLVISGRGLCCYLHPDVLKRQMVADVDGDLVFCAIDEELRRHRTERKFVGLPTVVTKQLFRPDYSLSCIGALPVQDEFEVYLGMDGKFGIGEATNLCYRGILIAQIAYQQTEELRNQFWDHVDRPDLRSRMPVNGDEQMVQRSFRHLSSLAIMDAVHPIYEGIFDLRKDDTIKPYLEHFLRALRGQEPMNFGYLGEMPVKGGLDTKPLELIWGASAEQDQVPSPTRFVNQYPVPALFFTGKNSSARKSAAMARIFELVRHEPDPAQYIEDELNGHHYTREVRNETVSTGDD